MWRENEFHKSEVDEAKAQSRERVKTSSEGTGQRGDRQWGPGLEADQIWILFYK